MLDFTFSRIERFYQEQSHFPARMQGSMRPLDISLKRQIVVILSGKLFCENKIPVERKAAF